MGLEPLTLRLNISFRRKTDRKERITYVADLSLLLYLEESFVILQTTFDFTSCNVATVTTRLTILQNPVIYLPATVLGSIIKIVIIGE